MPRLIAGLILCLCLRVVAGSAEASHKSGLVIVAHGASTTWNERVLQVAEKVDWPGPKGVVFLMKAPPENDLATVMARIEQAGVERIVVVPLLVSSFSNHFEEIRYYTGARTTPPEHAHHKPVKTRARLVMTSAMDDHELISQVLASQARQISTRPDGETLVLVAHGPNDEAENRVWLEKLSQHAARIQKELPFRKIEVTTLRDDAPKPVRDAATEQLRGMVKSASAEGRVLVVPVLVSVGHIQKQIRERLAGLDYTMAEFGIASQPEAEKWIRAQALAAE